MASRVRTYPTIHPQSREEWRAWLAENHHRSPGVWITYFKKSTGQQTLTYEEAVQEALSYGWIDSLPNLIDEQRYKQLFSPRKKGSAWARSNKRRVEKLIEQGRMTPAGLAKIEEAKKDGSWGRLDDVEDLVVPEELARALEANIRAKENFDAFSGPARKQFLYWLANAKRPETRAKRIKQIVHLAEKNERLAQFMSKKRSP